MSHSVARHGPVARHGCLGRHGLLARHGPLAAAAPVMAATAALLLATTALLPGTARAQEVEVSGQIRPRLETRDPATLDGRGQTFTSMRTRLSVAAELLPSVTAFVQIQDVRLFGEEASTLGDFDADALDVHQAWVELGAADEMLGARIGRQEVVFGGQRLVGAVNWTQQARSFDGARVRVGQDGARARVDAFAFQLAESAAAIHGSDAAFLGGYGTLGVADGRTLELYALWNREELADADTEQGTTGARYVGAAGRVDYRVEGALQFGERRGRDVGAWFFGARAGTAFADGDGRVTLWYDHLSGNDPDGEDVGVFSTLFATNHKFYGFADLFLDIPFHTAGRGLRDAAVKTSWTPAGKWSVGLDLHRLSVAEDAGLESGHLADEADLTVGYLLVPGARLTGGFSYVFEGDALSPVRSIDEDVTFGYVMLDVVF